MFVRYVFGDQEGFKEECRRVILQSVGDNGDDEEKGKGKEGGGVRDIGWDANVVPKRVHGMIYKSHILRYVKFLLIWPQNLSLKSGSQSSTPCF